MKTLLIPPLLPYSLSPVADENTIKDLPILGVPLHILISDYLKSFNCIISDLEKDIYTDKQPSDFNQNTTLSTTTLYQKNNYKTFNFKNSDFLIYEENLITDYDLSFLKDLVDNSLKEARNLNNKYPADLTVILKPLSFSKDGIRIIMSNDNYDIKSGFNLNTQNDLNNKIGYIADISRYAYTETPFSYSAAGIYAAHPTTTAAYNFIQKLQEPVNAKNLNGYEIISQALALNLKVRGITVSEKTFISVNTFKDYLKCHTDILKKKLPRLLKLTSNAKEIREGFWIEQGGETENNVIITPPVFISSGCRISKGSKLGPHVYLGKNTVIREKTEITHSIVGSGCKIAPDCNIFGSILSKNVSVGKNTTISENAVIDSDCRIENNCTVAQNVKISRNKRIAEGTKLNSNLLKASLATEHIFKSGAIDGEFNIDITPEFMSKLGCALGTMMSDSKIGISYDSTPVCRLLATSAITGILSTGSRIYDFKAQPLPLLRQGIRKCNLSSGIYISHVSDNGIFCPKITFLNNDGSNFDTSQEKNFENIYFDGAYLRCSTDKIKDIININGYRTIYEENLLSLINSSVFNINAEVRTVSETISEILEPIFDELEQKSISKATKEFSVDISRNGEEFNLYLTDLTPVNKYQKLVITSYILIKHFNVKEIVLPVSAPKSLTDKIKSFGVKVITCAASDIGFLREILRNNLMLQFGLCFDGIFFSVILLDFMNINNIKINDFISKIPDYSISESEIECPDIKKSEIISKLYNKYTDYQTDLTHGIKIYQKEGWILVFPEEYRHCIKVITEGYTTEAAKDLSLKFTNQIKRLAKPR